MPDKQVAGFGIPEGQLTQLSIPIGSMAGALDFSLPVWVFCGLYDGPGMLLTAGVHGNETNGTELIRQLICENTLQPVRGMVIAIPVVNTSGFMFRSRMTMPDGKDLNRSFPGSAHGSLVARLAHVLMQHILPHIQVGIDFHTGSEHIENYPQLCGMFAQGYVKEMANAFAAPFVVPVEPIEHSFRKEAQKMGKPILTYEGGEAMRLDPYAIEQGKAGVKRLMQHLQMTATPPPPDQVPVSVWVRNPGWVRAPEAGIFQSFVVCGARVRKNELLGSIADPFGTSQWVVKSPQDGYVLSLQRGAVVNVGDALIQIGK